MAESRIEVDTDALSNDIEEIRASIQTADRNLKNMFDEVNEMNAMWKGQANQAYNTQFRMDYAEMAEILEDLKAYAEALKEARNAYNRCEGAVEDIVRSIRV